MRKSARIVLQELLCLHLADQLMSVSKTNVLGALQVFDPSFRIAENNMMGSNPNSVPELYIRGRSGIGTTELDAESLSKSALKNNPNLPTFIMDGFEISVEKLYDMDPSRIESITILKDAAATAMLWFACSQRGGDYYNCDSEAGKN